MKWAILCAPLREGLRKERGPWKQKRRENKRDNGQMRKRGKGWQTGERRGVKRTR